MADNGQVSLYGPQSEQHTVVYSARQSLKEINARRRAKTPAIKGETTDSHLRIWVGDICLQYTENMRVRGPYTGKSFLEVFSSLANFGTYGDSKHAMIKSVRFGGIAGTATLVSSENKSPYLDITVMFGGTITILNTGTEVIFPGDRLYWDLPANEIQAAVATGGMPGRPPNTFVPLLMPYKPEQHALNANLIRDINTAPARLSRTNPTPRTDPISDGAQKFMTAVSEIMLLGIMLDRANAFGDHNDGSFGGVVLDEGMLRTALRSLTTYRNQPMALKRVCEGLDLIPVDRTAEGEWNARRYGALGPPRGGIPGSRMMQDYIMKLLVPIAPAEHIVDYVMGMPDIPKRVYDAQNNVIPQLLSSVVATNDYTTSRIIGHSFTKAGPLKAVDVILGGYGV